MNNLRRHIMMQQIDYGDGYIQNGLVFWLDGINKGATDGTWVDLVGGNVFAIYTGTPTSLDDGWRFNGNDMFYCPTMQPLFNDYDPFTMEICLKSEASNKIAAYLVPCVVAEWNGQVTYFVRINNYGTDSKSYRCSLAQNSTLSFSSARGVGNMISLSNGVNDGWGSIGTMVAVVGGRYGNNTYGFIGKIHSIRIYNRYLTLGEILHNQQVDNERFNLGL